MSKTAILIIASFLAGALVAGSIGFAATRFSIDVTSRFYTESLMLSTANNIESYIDILREMRMEEVRGAEQRMEYLLDGEILVSLGAHLASEGTRNALKKALENAREYRNEYPSPQSNAEVLELLNSALAEDIAP